MPRLAGSGKVSEGAPTGCLRARGGYLAGTRGKAISGTLRRARGREGQAHRKFQQNRKAPQTHPKVHRTGGDGRLTSLGENSSTATTPRRRHATSAGPDRQPGSHEEEGAGGAAGRAWAESSLLPVL